MTYPNQERNECVKHDRGLRTLNHLQAARVSSSEVLSDIRYRLMRSHYLAQIDRSPYTHILFHTEQSRAQTGLKELLVQHLCHVVR